MHHVALNHLITGALAWNPQVRGALYVLIALVVLPGSVYLILATDLGARLGFLVAAAGFFGWMFTLGSVGWVYGTGPKGREPTWKPTEVVVGELSDAARNPEAADFPKGWEKLELTDP